MIERSIRRPDHRPPWLVLDLGRPHRVLGWPVVGPAEGVARTIAWLQVRPGDLPVGVDPGRLFEDRAGRCGMACDVGLMTGADVGRFALAEACEAGAGATVVTTAGLGNAVAIGSATPPEEAAGREARLRGHVGTINMVAVLDRPLLPAAHLEALSIVAEARTAAVLSLGLADGEGRAVTGTGTDCIVVAAPIGPEGRRWCGLHTPEGRALAAAAHRSVGEACATWLALYR